MREHPNSWEEVTLRHKIVHHTLIPVVGITMLAVVASPFVWLLGLASLSTSLLYPWVVLSLAILYISIFGDFVIPAESYRRLREEGKL